MIVGTYIFNRAPLSSTYRKMNRFSVFYLLAFFHISYANDSDERELYCKISEASFVIYIPSGTQIHTFNTGDVYLYKSLNNGGSNLNWFMINYDSDKFTNKFPMAQDNTAVTEERITLTMADATITLILQENTFAFYQRLLPFDPFIGKFSVKTVFQGKKNLDHVSAIAVNELARHNWILVALANDTPWLILPKACCSNLELREDSDTVTLTLRARREVVISMEFDDPFDAMEFYDFIDSI